MSATTIDVILLASLTFKAHKPGRCQQCGLDAINQLVTLVDYTAPEVLLASIQGGVVNADETGDRLLTALAERQARCVFTPTRRKAVCLPCALARLQAHYEGPGVVTANDRVEFARLARVVGLPALIAPRSYYVGLVWVTERGPQGKTACVCVSSVHGPIAPADALRAVPRTMDVATRFSWSPPPRSAEPYEEPDGAE